MKRMLYWLVKWPWIAAIVVFLGLAQLPLGPWYISAWFMIGAALLAMILARAAKFRLAEAIILQTGKRQPVTALRPQDVAVQL